MFLTHQGKRALHLPGMVLLAAAVAFLDKQAVALAAAVVWGAEE